MVLKEEVHSLQVFIIVVFPLSLLLPLEKSVAKSPRFTGVSLPFKLSN